VHGSWNAELRLLLIHSQLVRNQMGAILKLPGEHSLRAVMPRVALEDDIRRMRATWPIANLRGALAEVSRLRLHSLVDFLEQGAEFFGVSQRVECRLRCRQRTAKPRHLDDASAKKSFQK
jgi:hypothetical protein